MGLGADTIQALAEGPYRRAAEMRLRDLDRIRAVVELRKSGVPDRELHSVVVGCGQLDVFEAVAQQKITSEEGAWFLMLRRTERPWYVRLALWIWGGWVSVPTGSTE